MLIAQTYIAAMLFGRLSQHATLLWVHLFLCFHSQTKMHLHQHKRRKYAYREILPRMVSEIPISQVRLDPAVFFENHILKISKPTFLWACRVFCPINY